jgi:hypothetical protein
MVSRYQSRRRYKNDPRAQRRSEGNSFSVCSSKSVVTYFNTFYKVLKKDFRGCRLLATDERAGWRANGIRQRSAACRHRNRFPRNCVSKICGCGVQFARGDKMKIQLWDPIPVEDSDGLQKHRHLFEEGQRVTVVDGAHRGRRGRIIAINAHRGHVVRLDSNHQVEYGAHELEPENFSLSSAKISKFDPLPISDEPLAKRRTKVAVSQLRAGMSIAGSDGQVCKITRIRAGGIVDYEFDGGDGSALADSFELA